MSDYYTPAQVSTITGASKPAIRNYTQLYAKYFSTESTPEKGKSRIFTAADVKLIAFIREKTVDQNQSHDDTRKALDSGELEQFVWSLPNETAQAGEAEPNTQYQLIPVERLQAALSLLEDARTREAQARGFLHNPSKRCTKEFLRL